MNQLLTVNTRFGEATALFNTIHNRLISVTQNDDDLTKRLDDYELKTLQSDLTYGRGFGRAIKAARVVRTAMGTFVFPLRGRDCESRRSEMAFQITMWMIGTSPNISQIWARSFAQIALENSERFTNLVYEAGHDECKLSVSGRVLVKTSRCAELVILEGR